MRSIRRLIGKAKKIRNFVTVLTDKVLIKSKYMLYGHGDDFYNAKNEVKINFSSNVWHGANLDKLKEHLIEHFDKLTRYPEPDAATLKDCWPAGMRSRRRIS